MTDTTAVSTPDVSSEPRILWRPDPATITALDRFAASIGRAGHTYDQLWRWSISDLEGFWRAVVDHLGIRWRTEPTAVLGRREMPGTQWFPGARVSFAEHIFADRDDDAPCVIARSEASEQDETWTWRQLREETARVRAALVAAGVNPGDRVAAYLPNIPATLAAFLATASLGAVWSCIAPEFGTETVLARFRQFEPTILLAVDGYRYKGRSVERVEHAHSIASALGVDCVRYGLLDRSGWDPAFIGAGDPQADQLEFVDVPFDHPLWVLYSSGTTGPPKAIVHSQGGALLELFKTAVLQADLQPTDRFFWYTTTGWVMWNMLLTPLLAGATVVLYDGHPGDEQLWDLAADTGVTVFGASAAWFDAKRIADDHPGATRDLSAVRAIGSTGSPLPAECYDWVYRVFPDRTWLFSISGGTDVVTALLGLTPTVPVYRGELGPPSLGVDLQAWSQEGVPLIDEVGEMVMPQPMPSMPVALLADPDDTRLRNAYFEQFPDVWTHGDWWRFTSRGTGIIYGRSDATINRGGVRIGTAEIYRAIEDVDGLTDTVAVDLAREGTHGVLTLLVECGHNLAEYELDPALVETIRTRLRRRCSPRHVPDEIVGIRTIPRTISGKKLEVPVKRILMGDLPDEVLSRGSLADPTSVEDVIAIRDLITRR